MVAHLCDRGRDAVAVVEDSSEYARPAHDPEEINAMVRKQLAAQDHYDARIPEALAITLREFNCFTRTRGA